MTTKEHVEWGVVCTLLVISCFISSSVGDQYATILTFGALCMVATAIWDTKR